MNGDLVFSSKYTFNNASTNGVQSLIQIDSTHVLIAYRDVGNSSYGTACIGTISNNTISWGSEYVFNSASTATHITCAKLDSTHFVIYYNSNNSQTYGIVGTISNGNQITWGTAVSTAIGNTAYGTCQRIDDTHFITAYRSPSPYYGRVMVGTVSSGDVITWGSAVAFNSASTSGVALTVFDTSKFVVSYTDAGNSNYGTCIVGSLDGSFVPSFSGASEYVFNYATSNIWTTKVDSTHFLLSYTDGGNSSYGTCQLATVSDNTVSYGGEVVFNSNSTQYIHMSLLDSTHFVPLS